MKILRLVWVMHVYFIRISIDFKNIWNELGKNYKSIQLQNLY